MGSWARLSSRRGRPPSCGGATEGSVPPFLLPVGAQFRSLEQSTVRQGREPLDLLGRLLQSEMRMDDRGTSDQGPGPIWVDVSVIVAQIAAIVSYVFWAMP